MESASAVPTVEIAQRTDPGRDPLKQTNEDACAYRVTALGHLLVLCDGMGGHMNGREAANLAVDATVSTFASAEPPADASLAAARARELLGQAIALANRRVFDMGGATKLARPGSTVVALLLHAGGAEIAHVGDSRCYLVHGEQIFQLTKDHTVVQQMVDAARLTPEEAAGHPDANRITRALGTSADVEVDVRAQTTACWAGDAFVLCSDGLSDLVQPEEIQRVVAASPPERAVEELVDLANSRGGHDNITAMVLRTPEGAGGRGERAASTLVGTLVDPVGVAAAARAAAAAAGLLPGAAQASAEGQGQAERQAQGEGQGQGYGQAEPSVPAPISSRGVAATIPFAMPGAIAPGAMPSGAVPQPAPSAAPAPLLPTAALPSAPAPVQQRPKKATPVALVAGIVLAVVGLAAAGYALYLVLNPNQNVKQVAPFALTGFGSARPQASLVPVAPEAPPEPADPDAVPPAPLPSLVPANRPPKRGGRQ